MRFQIAIISAAEILMSLTFYVQSSLFVVYMLHGYFLQDLWASVMANDSNFGYHPILHCALNSESTMKRIHAWLRKCCNKFGIYDLREPRSTVDGGGVSCTYFFHLKITLFYYRTWNHFFFFSLSLNLIKFTFVIHFSRHRLCSIKSLYYIYLSLNY